MASSKLLIFTFVFGAHFLILLIGVFSNNSQKYATTDNQKIKLTFISQFDKVNVDNVTKPIEPKFKPKPSKIKKKFESVKKKKIVKNLSETTIQKRDEEPIIDNQENIHRNDDLVNKPDDSLHEVKTAPKSYSSSKNLFASQIKTRAGIGKNIAQCKPNYPRTSKRRGEQGTVILRFLINENGKAEKAEIKQSSGYQRLDNAAKTGLFSCKFTPASINGVFIKDWAVIPYVFQLK